ARLYNVRAIGFLYGWCGSVNALLHLCKPSDSTSFRM
ncbi:molybdopterin oxidoreductase family protein, partial [Vibrio parahaemolyticus V-223/04]